VKCRDLRSSMRQTVSLLSFNIGGDARIRTSSNDRSCVCENQQFSYNDLRIAWCRTLVMLRGRTKITSASIVLGLVILLAVAARAGQGDIRLRSEYRFFQVQDLYVGPGRRIRQIRFMQDRIIDDRKGSDQFSIPNSQFSSEGNA